VSPELVHTPPPPDPVVAIVAVVCILALAVALWAAEYWYDKPRDLRGPRGGGQ
jgi:hypothetical protein